MKQKKISYTVLPVLKLAGMLKAYTVPMTVTIVCGILNHLAAVSVSVLCAYIVSLALTGQLVQRYFMLLLILCALIVLRVVFYFSEMWLAHFIAFKVLAKFRINLLEAIERVSPAILLGLRSGQLATTLMSDVELLEWFFAHSFGSLIVAVAVTAILLIFLGSIHMILPLILLVFLVIIVEIPFLMKRQASEEGMKIRERLGEANAITVEGVQGMREILMLNHVEAYRSKNRKYMQKMYDSQLKYGKRLGTEGALLQLALGVSMISVMAAAAGLIIVGEINVSYYTIIVILAGMTFGPVIEVCNTARNFGLIFAASDRVFQVLETKPLVKDTGKNIDIRTLKKEICFHKVSFRYQPDLEPAVHEISFTVKEGETVALVGSSGAGKSTCVNLLLRYWEPEKGSVSIGGCSLKDMTLDNLRFLTSAVLQEVFLFQGTLRENIRLGRQESTDREVEAAAKGALIHDFIVSLPQGYDTMAGERGVSLSGGQRQRIAIARAILKDSPILILDEAVSSLDAENEFEIQKVLANQGHRTTLIVAHRLSTILSADRLIVLKDGRVVQTGTHEALMGQPGFYRELVGPQLNDAD